MHTKYKPVKFPLDESFHNYIIEWWYFNGNLEDARGNEYSFMDCLFRVDVKKFGLPVLSRIPLKTAYFSHSLVSAIKTKKYYHRIAPFSILSDDSFSKPLLYINYLNPQPENGYTNCVMEKIDGSRYHIKNEDVDLYFTSQKKPLLEGGKGYLNLHSKTTYYYSLTRLKTQGRIRLKNKWIEVTGKSWMDHQWADSNRSLDRWDWFSIQLDNGAEMVCFVYDDGKVRTHLADIIYSDSKQGHLKNVKITPLKKHWTSPKSGASYPLEWEIEVPGKDIKLNLTARIPNQEMLFGSINYWEGPLVVSGVFSGKKVKGLGFMELVGYPSRYTGIKYLTEEIGHVAARIFSGRR
ncbi:MAG: lipocalin family protein [Candidatus Saccharibacteria bacterium]